MKRALQDEQFKLLNLCRDWLHSLLPHVLSKRNRVAYGLLLPRDLRTAMHVPQARKMLAVPFIGKDCPSDASQFSHPDVVIGLTILAYRYEGLRFADFKRLMQQLQHDLSIQLGPFKHRPAAAVFRRWVAAAGLQVRGGTVANTQESTPRSQRRTSISSSGRSSISSPVNAAAGAAANDVLGDVPPLHLIDLEDAEQMDRLFELLRLEPLLIKQYLEETVFPSTMAFATLKFSASGQELGGDLLFGARLGFSGTPSDLLP